MKARWLPSYVRWWLRRPKTIFLLVLVLLPFLFVSIASLAGGGDVGVHATLPDSPFGAQRRPVINSAVRSAIFITREHESDRLLHVARGRVDGVERSRFRFRSTNTDFRLESTDNGTRERSTCIPIQILSASRTFGFASFAH